MASHIEVNFFKLYFRTEILELTTVRVSPDKRQKWEDGGPTSSDLVHNKDKKKNVFGHISVEVGRREEKEEGKATGGKTERAGPHRPRSPVREELKKTGTWDSEEPEVSDQKEGDGSSTLLFEDTWESLKTQDVYKLFNSWKRYQSLDYIWTLSKLYI